MLSTREAFPKSPRLRSRLPPSRVSPVSGGQSWAPSTLLRARHSVCNHGLRAQPPRGKAPQEATFPDQRPQPRGQPTHRPRAPHGPSTHALLTPGRAPARGRSEAMCSCRRAARREERRLRGRFHNARLGRRAGTAGTAPLPHAPLSGVRARGRAEAWRRLPGGDKSPGSSARDPPVDPGHRHDRPGTRRDKPKTLCPGLVRNGHLETSPGNHRTPPQLISTASGLDGFGHRWWPATLSTVVH